MLDARNAIVGQFDLAIGAFNDLPRRVGHVLSERLFEGFDRCVFSALAFSQDRRRIAVGHGRSEINPAAMRSPRQSTGRLRIASEHADAYFKLGDKTRTLVGMLTEKSAFCRVPIFIRRQKITLFSVTQD